MLDVRQVAGLLRVSAGTVSRLVEKGLLPKLVRILRAIRWRKEQIDASIDELSKPGPNDEA